MKLKLALIPLALTAATPALANPQDLEIVHTNKSAQDCDQALKDQLSEIKQALTERPATIQSVSADQARFIDTIINEGHPEKATTNTKLYALLTKNLSPAARLQLQNDYTRVSSSHVATKIGETVAAAAEAIISVSAKTMPSYPQHSRELINELQGLISGYCQERAHAIQHPDKHAANSPVGTTMS